VLSPAEAQKSALKTRFEMLEWRGFLRGRVENIEMAEDFGGFVSKILEWPKVFERVY
jgi:hypothetical protein